MDADTSSLGTCAGKKLPHCNHSHPRCHRVENVPAKDFTFETTQPVAPTSSDTSWKCHACGVSSLFPKATSNEGSSTNNSTDLGVRNLAKMPPTPTKPPDPLIDDILYYAFPPASSTDIPHRPPTATQKAPALGSITQDLDAARDMVPLDELHIHLGHSNSQLNYDQLYEAPYPDNPIVDPSLMMEPLYGGSSYLPMQETISPYLLNCQEDANDFKPPPGLYDMASFNGDFSDINVDGVPALTCNLASPQIGGLLATPKPIDTSPLFSVHDNDLALVGLGASWGEPQGMGPDLPPDHLGLESLDYPPIHGEMGVQNQPYPLPSQPYPLPVDNMLFSGVSDPNSGHLDPQFGQYISPPPDNMYNLGANDLFQDKVIDWQVQSTESPTQDASRRHSKGRSTLRDTSKDELLVNCKAQGMSYKQIKELGGFDEAESTLRGRYRALTKPREARLRKPEWGKREVSIINPH